MAVGVVVGLWQLSAPSEAIPRSPIDMIVNSDPVTKAVLALLAVLSLMSWGIMYAKWRAFRAAEAKGSAFVRDFERSRDMDDAMLVA